MPRQGKGECAIVFAAISPDTCNAIVKLRPRSAMDSLTTDLYAQGVNRADRLRLSQRQHHRLRVGANSSPDLERFGSLFHQHPETVRQFRCFLRLRVR